MGFIKPFLVNISMLLSVTFLALLIYKQVLRRLPQTVLSGLAVLFAVGLGWLSMKFSFTLPSGSMFDLRFVPLIVLTFLLPDAPLLLILAGVGIGLMRLTFGLDVRAWSGFVNLTILGLLCAAISAYLPKLRWPTAAKFLAVIVLVNAFNVLNIVIFGVIPADVYLRTIVPYLFPLSVVLSMIFVFLIYVTRKDLYHEREISRTNEKLLHTTEELQAIKEELEEKARRLLVLSQYRAEFLADLAAEIRSPLNNIIMIAEIQKSGADEEQTPEELQSLFEIVFDSGKDILELLGEIQDLSQVESGRLQVECEEVNLTEFPEILLHKNLRLAEAHGLELDFTLTQPIPPIFYSDGMRMERIAASLVSTAIQAAPSGAVHVDLRRAKTGEIPFEHNLHNYKEWIAIAVSFNRPPQPWESGLPGEHQSIRQVTRFGLTVSNELAHLLAGFVALEESGDRIRFLFYLPNRSREAELPLGSRDSDSATG